MQVLGYEDGITSVTDPIRLLASKKDIFYQKYGAKTFGVFGSFLRGEQSPSSELDILVEFDHPNGVAFVTLAEEREELPGVKVDLVSKRAVNSRMLALIEKELCCA